LQRAEGSSAYYLGHPERRDDYRIVRPEI